MCILTALTAWVYCTNIGLEYFWRRHIGMCIFNKYNLHIDFLFCKIISSLSGEITMQILNCYPHRLQLK